MLISDPNPVSRQLNQDKAISANTSKLSNIYQKWIANRNYKPYSVFLRFDVYTSMHGEIGIREWILDSLVCLFLCEHVWEVSQKIRD